MLVYFANKTLCYIFDLQLFLFLLYTCMYVSLCVCVVLLSLLRITRICKYIVVFFLCGRWQIDRFYNCLRFDSHIQLLVTQTSRSFSKLAVFFFHIKKEMPNLCLFTKIYLFIQEKKKTNASIKIQKYFCSTLKKLVKTQRLFEK